MVGCRFGVSAAVVRSSVLFCYARLDARWCIHCCCLCLMMRCRRMTNEDVAVCCGCCYCCGCGVYWCV